MKIAVSRLKELINEELKAFNEEQDELEEGSGDRNDDDREAGHGPQRQRAGSAGNPGEYLEENEEEMISEQHMDWPYPEQHAGVEPGEFPRGLTPDGLDILTQLNIPVAPQPPMYQRGGPQPSWEDALAADRAGKSWWNPQAWGIDTPYPKGIEWGPLSLEEASGDRNDPDREQGRGNQRQRAGSAGNPGEYLEEDEELEEKRRYPDRLEGHPTGPNRVRLEEYVAGVVDEYLGANILEEAGVHDEWLESATDPIQRAQRSYELGRSITPGMPREQGSRSRYHKGRPLVRGPKIAGQPITKEINWKKALAGEYGEDAKGTAEWLATQSKGKWPTHPWWEGGAFQGYKEKVPVGPAGADKSPGSYEFGREAIHPDESIEPSLWHAEQRLLAPPSAGTGIYAGDRGHGARPGLGHGQGTVPDIDRETYRAMLNLQRDMYPNIDQWGSGPTGFTETVDPDTLLPYNIAPHPQSGMPRAIHNLYPEQGGWMPGSERGFLQKPGAGWPGGEDLPGGWDPWSRDLNKAREEELETQEAATGLQENIAAVVDNYMNQVVQEVKGFPPSFTPKSAPAKALSKRFGVDIKGPEKGPSLEKALDTTQADAGEVKKKIWKPRKRKEIQKATAPSRPDSYGVPEREQAAAPKTMMPGAEAYNLEEHVAAVIDQIMGATVTERKKPSKAEQAASTAQYKKGKEVGKGSQTPERDDQPPVPSDTSTDILNQTTETAPINESLTEWYNKTLFKSLTKKWTK
jgi:hypothetical protein